MSKISVLCVEDKSNYFKVPNLDLYTRQRNAYTFTGTNVVICHPPCAQWSRLHSFAKENKQEKELALFCWEKVNANGGILEHPSGTHLFKYVNANRKKIISVDQHWWNFSCRKRTLLYFNEVEMLPFPLNFDAYKRQVHSLTSSARSLQPFEFCQYLVMCAQTNIKNALHQTPNKLLQ